MPRPDDLLAALSPSSPLLVAAWLDSDAGEALAERARTLMNPDEQARHDRYRFERNRREFRVTRSLVNRARRSIERPMMAKRLATPNNP